MPRHVLVIGAGVAGLSCALELAKAGIRVTVLEREPQVGGMAASFEEGDRDTAGQAGSDYWSWDFGPHRFHSDEPEVLAHAEEILGANHVWSKRLSRIYLFDRFFDYPLVLSNVLRNMPRITLLWVLSDYAWTRLLDMTGLRKYADRNFQEWVERRFGRKLSRIFFTEYTEKTWGLPATQISSAWARQRITLLNLTDTIRKTIFKPKNIPRTLVTDFIYPEVGGIGELSRSYARKIEELGGRILVSAPVVKVHLDGQRVTGVEYRHDKQTHLVEPDDFISTIPITVLVQCVEPRPPQEVRLAAKSLGYVSILFIYLKLAKPRVSPDSWIYLPQKTLRVHRISEFKNFSARCAPPDQTLICAEITCPPGEGLWRASPEELRDIAVEDLSRIGLLQREEVLGSFVKRVWHAYPLYDLDYEKKLQPVMAFVRGLENLRSGGRQGLYRYNNMDQSIQMGHRMAHATLHVGDADFESVATEQKYFG